MKKLTLYDSSVLKGIAILLMLCHHLFYTQDGSFWDVQIYGHGLINTFAHMCKVCVAIFVFISGYGLMEKYKDIEKIELKSFFWNRFIKLMLNYWFVWLLFVPMSVLWLGPSLIEQYGNSHIITKLIFDFMGIINWFGSYNYNPTWWFYACIIGLYLLFPILHYLVNRNILYVIAVGIGIYYLPTDFFMSIRFYVLAFICGMLYAKYDMTRLNKITPPPTNIG